MNEDNVEQLAINLLQAQGYEYVYGPDLAPDGQAAARASYADVVLMATLRHIVGRLNPAIPPAAQEQAIREVLQVASPDLISSNQAFHTYLTDGIPVEYQQDGLTRGDKVWLVDFETPANNHFQVVNQLTITENNVPKRPDVILFINGLPLVLIELKNPADKNATIRKAFDQVQTYKAALPSLLMYNSLLVISDGLEAQAGALSAGFSRFAAWKSSDGQKEASPLVSQLETLIKGLLNKETLLDMIRHFTVFEKSKSEDPQTGLTVVETVKKIAYYHQYYAVNKAVDSTRQAAAVEGSRKGGVFWHTQGSGKSLSMVFYTGKLVLSLDNPTVVVITDRNDLDDQLFDTFAACNQLLRQPPVQANSRTELRRLLQVAAGGIVFTTIHKFFPDDGGDTYPQLSDRRNIVVIADEAHRTQYGFQAKEVDVKDEAGQVIGKQTRYGFAKYLRDALPQATFMGFTGTPIESTDINTPAIFGHYVDVYDIAQAVEDGATVPIYYESRLAKVRLDEQGRQMLDDLDEELADEELTLTQQAKAKWTQLEAIVGSSARLKNIAQDITTHFQRRQEIFAGKGMIVTMSRRIAAALYREIITLYPDWHSDDLDRGRIKVIMTASSDDGPEMAQHHTTKQQRRRLAARFKAPDDPLHLVIVVDMWLTGFDAPALHTLYIDKPLKGHTLMQAIARVNRVYLDKPGGLVVDYLGIASDLKKALSFYADSGGEGDPAIRQEQAVDLMLAKLEIIDQLLAGFNYRAYFTADTSQKLAIILAAEEHILGLDNGKARFAAEVAALAKALALAIPHEQAMAAKETVAFFQAVNARLQKFDPNRNGRSNAEIETAIRQVVDQAIASDQVVDIFDAAGMEKPNISILSEEFLAEVQGLPHQNLALELLKKLLNDELRSRRKTNLIQSKKLSEMLEKAIRRYQNKLLTTAEVIEELIALAKDIREADARGEAVGLSSYELAFYDALADNDSAVEVLGVDKLRELAIVLVERVKQNSTIDWSIKESAQARMKVMVKRLLRRYGYPPDMQALATETVLEQAKLLAEYQVGEVG